MRILALAFIALLVVQAAWAGDAPAAEVVVAPRLTVAKDGTILVAYALQHDKTNSIVVDATSDGVQMRGAKVISITAYAGHGEGPSIAVQDHNVYVSYTDMPGNFRTSNIYCAASTDGGANFQPAVKINDDRTSASHMWQSLA